MRLLFHRHLREPGQPEEPLDEHVQKPLRPFESSGLPDPDQARAIGMQSQRQELSMLCQFGQMRRRGPHVGLLTMRNGKHSACKARGHVRRGGTQTFALHHRASRSRSQTTSESFALTRLLQMVAYTSCISNQDAVPCAPLKSRSRARNSSATLSHAVRDCQSHSAHPVALVGERNHEEAALLCPHLSLPPALLLLFEEHLYVLTL